MYLDLLFFISVVMHYFLLLFTAKLFHRKMSRGRLLAGASLGALAVLLLPYPHPTGLTVTVILLAPLLMVSAAFWPLRFPEILFYGGAFFLVAFTVAGAITALLNYTPLRLFFCLAAGEPAALRNLHGALSSLRLAAALLRREKMAEALAGRAPGGLAGEKEDRASISRYGKPAPGSLFQPSGDRDRLSQPGGAASTVALSPPGRRRGGTVERPGKAFRSCAGALLYPYPLPRRGARQRDLARP